MKGLIKIDTSSWELRGELTFANVAQLINIELDFDTEDTAVIDLTRLTYADSAGLALLVYWVRQAKINGQKLRYRGMPTKLASLVRVAGLESMAPDLDLQRAS